MIEVTYRIINPETGKVAQTLEASLLGLVYNAVGLTESAIIPPFAILNERLLSGGQCNPFGTIAWEPFKISQDDYEQLCADAESTDPNTIHSFKGIAFVKLRRVIELDTIRDSDQWSQHVGAAYSNDYIAALTRLNSSDESNPAIAAVDSGDEPATAIAAPVSQENVAVEKPDLDEIHQVLLRLSSAAIRRFAYEHRDKRFYAFAFDLNAEYGNVLLSANTEAAFEETAEQYVKDWNYSEEQLVELKRNVGDWHYMGFNHDQPEWTAGWSQHELAIDRYVFSEQTSEEDAETFTAAFIETCAMVLLELERAGQLDVLNQEPGFYLQCTDHDEDRHEADRRLDGLRRKFKE